MQRKILIASIIIIPVLISLFVSWLILTKPKSSSQRLSQFPTATPTPQDIIEELVFPAHNASTLEIDNFYKTALAKAHSTPEITLSSCNASPKIIKVAQDTAITIQNTDLKARTLMIGRTNKYTIPAKGKITVAANFGKDIGTYGYSCDNAPTSAGIIVLTNNTE
jgi:hypothetical protein